MKNVIKSILVSIGFSTAVFCIVGVISDIMYNGKFEMANYSFTKTVLGCICIGIGWGAPTVIYSNEKIPYLLKILIHAMIGCFAYTATALLVGWIPSSKGIVYSAFIFGVQLAAELFIAAVIWLCFYIHYKKLADKMNEKINKL